MVIEQPPTATAEAPTPEPAPSYSPEPTPYQQFGSYEAVKAELTPIQERSVKGIVENVLAIAGLKSDGKEGDPILTDQESKDTVTLIPYILKKAMKTEMSQDNFETLTIGMHAGNLVSKVVKKRIESGKMFKEEKPEVAAQIPPVATNQPEPPKTPEPTPATSQIAAVNKQAPSLDEQQAAFKKRGL
jgi:hypothetical protein